MFNVFTNWGFEITYQSIGIVAAAVCILSFQIKNNKGFCIAQCIGSTLFAIQFFIGHAWAAAIMNTICIFRSITYAYVKNMRIRISFTVLFSILFTIAAIIAVTIFKDLWFLALLTGSASIVSSIGICTDNNKVIRWLQLFYVSPCWLTNNIYVRSVGAIITEAFAIVSVIIALVRFYIIDKKKTNSECNS